MTQYLAIETVFMSFYTFRVYNTVKYDKQNFTLKTLNETAEHAPTHHHPHTRAHTRVTDY